MDSSSLAAGAGGPLEEETCPFSRRGLPSPEVLPDNSKQHKNPITYQKEKHLTLTRLSDRKYSCINGSQGTLPWSLD